MQRVTHVVLSVFLLLGLILLPVNSLLAADEVVVIAANETREGSTFLTGDEVKIDGTINGDLYVAAENIYVNGTVNGDIIAAARNITISGQVQGDVRAAAQTIRFRGPVAGSATIGCETFYVEKQSAVARDLVLGCGTAYVDGSVNGSMFAFMENLFINGSIGKNVNAHIRTLKITDGASIGGNLVYVSSNKGDISENARIGGSQVWKPQPVETEAAGDKDTPFSIGGFLISLAGILIIYALARKWRPQLWDNLAQPARDRVLSAVGMGLLLLIAVPILAILSMVTLIGIPLGIIAFITYGVLLYLSKLIASIYLADVLKIKYDLQQPWLWFVVLVALMLVVKIPVIGGIISFAVLALGLGCGFYSLFGKNDTKTDSPDTVA